MSLEECAPGGTVAPGQQRPRRRVAAAVGGRGVEGGGEVAARVEGPAPVRVAGDATLEVDAGEHGRAVRTLGGARGVAAPHKDFSHLYEKMSGRGESAVLSPREGERSAACVLEAPRLCLRQSDTCPTRGLFRFV